MMFRALACLIALATPLAAQDDLIAITEAAQAQLLVAQESLAEAESASDRVSALTDVVMGYETGLAAMRAGLREVSAQRDVLQQDLNQRSGEVAQLLGALQSLSRTPPPLSSLHPNGPLDTIRAGMIIADVTPAMQAQVTTLRTQMDALEDLTVLQETTSARLRDGLQGAQDARAALGTAIQNRAPLPQRFIEDPIQTALLIANTDTLGSFASGLMDAVPAGPENTNALAAKGALTLPVTGKLRRPFNTADAAGVTRPGVILAAAPNALVTAPLPATILFRGPLLSYENVIILEPTAGVMFIFAGLSEVYGQPGDIVPAGAPLGILGGDLPQTDANLTTNTGQDSGTPPQTLYLEVRDRQTPVDPATWFALEQE